MARSSFGAVRLAAARPIFSLVAVLKSSRRTGEHSNLKEILQKRCIDLCGYSELRV